MLIWKGNIKLGPYSMGPFTNPTIVVSQGKLIGSCISQIALSTSRKLLSVAKTMAFKAAQIDENRSRIAPCSWAFVSFPSGAAASHPMLLLFLLLLLLLLLFLLFFFLFFFFFATPSHLSLISTILPKYFLAVS